MTLPKLFIALILIWAITGKTFAQNQQYIYHLELGDEDFRQNLFDEAVFHYLKALDKAGKEEQETVFLKLAQSYDKANKPEQAINWYRLIFEKDKRNLKNLWNYAVAINNTGNYKLAKKYYLLHADLSGEDKGKNFASFCDSAFVWINDLNPDYEIRELKYWNTPYRDFSAIGFKEGIIFSSSREYNENDILDFFYQEINVQLPLEEHEQPELYKEIFTSKKHEGPATFSKDFKKVFFTRTIPGFKINHKKVDPLNIFFCEKKEDKWTKPDNNFPFNHYSYSTGHPSFTPGGDTVYFMSDRPGGYGGTDLYFSVFENDEWTDPVNLGPEINTEGNELFPYITSEGKLYFSSNGRPGFGKLDIYVSQADTENGLWQTPKNLKSPVNSHYDDFSFSFFNNNDQGFFSSNRPGTGNDDLYSFSYPEIIYLKLDLTKVSIKETPFFNGIIFICHLDSLPQKTVIERPYKTIEAEKSKNYMWEGVKEEFHNTSVQTKLTIDSGNILYQVEVVPENKHVSVQGLLRAPTSKEIMPDEEILVFENEIPVDTITTDSSGNYSYLVKEKPTKLTVLNEEGKTAFENTKFSYLHITITDSLDPLTGVNITGSVDGKEIVRKNLGNSSTYIRLLREDFPLTLKFEKEGYWPYESTFKVTDSATEDTIRRIVMLRSRPFVELKGKVVFDDKKAEATKINIVKDNEVVKTIISDEDGSYSTKLYKDEKYSLIITKKGYFQFDTTIIATAPDTVNKIRESLALEVSKIKKGAEINLPNIYYNFNQFSLTKSAYHQLDNLAEFLRTNPNITIELSSHTDARGDSSYNMKLSQKRAEEAAKYLYSKGIEPERVIAKGYGESMPIIPNAKTEEEHEKNRRTQFKVLEIKEEEADELKNYKIFLMPEGKVLSKNHPIFKKFKDVKTEFTEGNVNYFIGPFSSLEKSKKTLKSLQDSGFDKAFIKEERIEK